MPHQIGHRTYQESIAYEKAANKRRKDAGLAGSASDYEAAANKRRKDAGLPLNAVEYEAAANLRSVAAGFKNAADQEIDANRRAREAGFKNAALQENPGAAAPGESIYSTDPFVDPRSVTSSAVKLPNQLYYNNEKTAVPKTAASYVDLSPDLAAAWAKIESDPTGESGSYWLPRMGNVSTKEAFGKAHAAEDMALKLGTYNQGDTDYKLGSDPWKELFTSKPGQFGTSLNYPGDQSTAEAPLTRWEQFDPQLPASSVSTTTADTTDTTTTADTTDSTSSVYVAPEVEIMDLATLTEDMDLSNKLEEIINMNSPLFKAASTKALQVMQKRGIVNSSLANEAVMSAILEVAMPIAQAEVQALQQNLYYNTDWSNQQKTDANKYFYETMLTKMKSALDTQLQKMIQSFGAWGKYGDWIQNIITSPGADQDAWQRMLDAMQGGGGWPVYPG